MDTVSSLRGISDCYLHKGNTLCMWFVFFIFNCSLVANTLSTPIAYSFIHTQKRNPRTHLKDADMFWDFISLRPETTHQVRKYVPGKGYHWRALPEKGMYPQAVPKKEYPGGIIRTSF